MAEAVAALSLAANIVQFIDFGGRVLSGSLKLYNSGPGSNRLGLANDTKVITQSLQRFIEGLNQPLEQSNSANEGPELSQTEIDLRSLAAHCMDIANELLGAIKKVELQGKGGKWTHSGRHLNMSLRKGKLRRSGSGLTRLGRRLLFIYWPASGTTAIIL